MSSPFSWRRSLLWLALLLIVLLAGLKLLSDPMQVWAAMRSLPAGLWAVILGLSVLNYALRFWRWRRFLTRLELAAETIPWPRHAAYYLAGFAFTLTPGKLGEGMRALYLKPHGVAVTATVSTVFAERMMDLLSMLLLALTSLAAPSMDIRLLPPAALLTLALLLALRSRWPERMMQRLPRAERFLPLCRQTRDLLRQPLFWAGTLLGAVGWGLEGYGFFLTLHYLAPGEVTALAALSIYALGVLAGALSFLPGGVGGAEAVMAGLLTQAAGLDLPVALAATLICRLATLWFAFLLGLLACGALFLTDRLAKSYR